MDTASEFLGLSISPFLKNLTLGIGAVIVGLTIKFILVKSFKFFARFWAKIQIQSILKHLSKPIGFFIPLLLLSISINYMLIATSTRLQFLKLTEVLLTINFAVILIGAIGVLKDVIAHKYDLNKENNLRERKIRTQLQFLRKFVIVLIVLVTTAIVLLSFESMRKIGAGLLTGVGIGGIIIGFAAQKSLTNLLAGFQIAFTQPIRIDDVLVVEGEWGRVEEISLTYVVVSIWDQRRLILPITYFIEKPFQNWTRVSAELLGTVFLYVDYNLSIPPLRDELTRLLNAHPLWDKRVNVVQVTDNKDLNVEVRFLMSARNSGQAFDLRCDIRENMIAFIRENYPDSLPKTRLEINPSQKNIFGSSAD